MPEIIDPIEELKEENRPQIVDPLTEKLTISEPFSMMPAHEVSGVLGDKRSEAGVRALSDSHEMKVSPQLALFLSEKLAEREKTDSELAKRRTTAWQRVQSSWTTGLVQNQLGLAGSDYLLTGNPDDYLRMLEVQSTMPEQYESEGPIEYSVRSAAKFLPMMIDTGIEASKQGLKVGMGFGLMTALLGQAGPQAAIPEEAFTVPAMTMWGYKIGATSKAFELTARKEGGLALSELMQLRDDKGNSIDPNIARAASFGVGVLNGVIELGQIRMLLKTIPGADKIFSAAAVEAFRSKSIKKRLLDIGKKYVGTVAGETGQEVAQESVNVVFEEIAKVLNNKYYDTEFDLVFSDRGVNRDQLMEVIQRMKDTALESAAGFSVVALPGSVTRAGLEITSKKESKGEKTIRSFVESTGFEEDSDYEIMGIHEEDEEGKPTFVTVVDKQTGYTFPVKVTSVEDKEGNLTVQITDTPEDLQKKIEAARAGESQDTVNTLIDKIIASEGKTEDLAIDEAIDFGKPEEQPLFTQFRSQVTEVLGDQQQADVVGKILEARAKAVGMSPDEYLEYHGLTVRQATAEEQAAFGATNKAAIDFADENNVIIKAFSNADVSSVVHELGHLFRRDMSAADLAIAEQWAGVKDGVWTKESEEKFAKGFERYMRTGEAPTRELQGVFDLLKNWLREIYKVIDQLREARVTPEIKQVFDNLLTESDKAERNARLEKEAAAASNDVLFQTLETLKDVADETAQSISIYKVTNPKFFEKFDWLTKDRFGDFKYTPESDNFVGVTKLHEIWQEANRQGERILYQSEPQAQPIYMKITSVADKFQGMKAQSVFNWLLKQGVKKAELEAIGLDLWLKAKKGTDKVTPEELQDFVKANNIETEDVMLGEVLSEENIERSKDLYYELEEMGFGVAFEDDDGFLTPSHLTYETDEGENIPVSNAQLTPEVIAKRDELFSLYGSEKTQFSTYQLPGSVDGSYREMFVAAPRTKEPTETPEYAELAEFFKQYIPKALPDDTLVWDEPNEEGFFTVSTFLGPHRDGILVEVFNTKEEASAFITKFNRYKELHSEIYRGGWQDGHSQYSDIENPIVRIRFNERTGENGERILFIEEMQGPSPAEQKKMPAYLRDNLYNIGVKRILAYAKQNGFDAVSWTTGEQQVTRYEEAIRKEVSAVYYMPKRQTLVAFDSRGNRVLNENNVTEERIEEFVGKEATKQLLESELKNEAEEAGGDAYYEISGLDLRVGGEGLKRLYDVTLPQMFEAYGREKVRESIIPIGKLESFTYDGVTITDPTLDEQGMPLSVSPEEYYGEAYTEYKKAARVVNLPQPSIPITNKTPQAFTLFQADTVQQQQDIMVTSEAIDEETGEVVTVEEKSDVALAAINERIDAYSKLLECLTR